MRSPFDSPVVRHGRSCLRKRSSRSHLNSVACAVVCCATALLCSQVRSQGTANQAVVEKIRAGQFRAAEADVTEHLKAEPGDASANFLLGYVLFREGRFTDSLAAYTAGARSRTPSSVDLVVVASDYVQLGSYPDAIRWLSYVTEHSPENATAWYLLGRSHFLSDRPEAALEAFQQALKLHPHEVRTGYNMGLALERLQRPSEAEAAYRQAMQWATAENSPDPQPWLDLGTLLLTQGRNAEATALLRVAAEKAPRNPFCLQQFGLALSAAGDKNAAIDALLRAVRLAPDAEQAHFYLARTYKALGRKDEADAEFAIVGRLIKDRSSRETPNPDVSASWNE